jgi:hypothetical protein
MMLALRLGRTLDELSSSMSSQEFSLWTALYREDQWGEARDDMRAGTIASTIANYAGKMRLQHAEPAQPSDFMPSLVKEVEEQEPDPVAFFSAVANSNKFEARG